MSETVDPRDVRKAGLPWTDNDVKRLRNLSLGGVPLHLIVREMGRPLEEVHRGRDHDARQRDAGRAARAGQAEPRADRAAHAAAGRSHRLEKG